MGAEEKMSQPFSFKVALLQFHAEGQLSRELFQQLQRLALLVLRSKGVTSEELYQDVFSLFMEKLLNFKSTLYLKMALYQEKQVRSFLSLTLHSVLIDYYRREKASQMVSLDTLEPWQAESLLPEESWHGYRFEALALYKQIWAQLSQDLQTLFCQLYDGGHNLEALAEIRQVSLGKVHKDKARLGEIIARECSFEEVAQMVYRLLALEFCLHGACRLTANPA